jgi:hypothetical protein
MNEELRKLQYEVFELEDRAFWIGPLPSRRERDGGSSL